MFLISATDVCVLAIGGSNGSSYSEGDLSAPALPFATFAIGAAPLGWTGRWFVCCGDRMCVRTPPSVNTSLQLPPPIHVSASVTDRKQE